MNLLLNYLNSLAVPEQKKLAKACKTSIGYLRKACSKGQKLGPELCVSLERESFRSVTRQGLRDDWQKIWPELLLTNETQSTAEPGDSHAK